MLNFKLECWKCGYNENGPVTESKLNVVSVEGQKFAMCNDCNSKYDIIKENPCDCGREMNGENFCCNCGKENMKELQYNFKERKII